MKDEKIKDLLARLEETIRWFELRKDIDIEEALKRVKESSHIIKTLKAKLKKVENEFEEVKKELDVDSD